MRTFCLLGLIFITGCSTTSPFSTTAQKPVPIAAQIAQNTGFAPGQPPPNQAALMAPGSQQQFTQTGPNSYSQAPKPGNPFLASLRSTTASIGNALTIQPQVIPASNSTVPVDTSVDIAADLHFQAAQVYESQNNTAGAITHFQKALETSPGDPKVLVGFGRLYDRQGDLRTAEGLYQQALQSDPNNCAALNAMGICSAKQGKLDVALAQLSRASQLQPQNARYKNNVANVLADTGRIEEAYAQLLSVHGEAGAHYNLGYLLLKQGKRDAARKELALALQANPYMEQARKVLNSLEPVRPASAVIKAPARYTVSQAHNSVPVSAPPSTPQAEPLGVKPFSLEGLQNLPPL